MKKGIILFLMCCFFSSFAVVAQNNEGEGKITTTFVFKAADDMFFLAGNEAELKKLYDFVEKYKAEIVSGNTPVYVTGYSSGYDAWQKNIASAKIRSNRVKSELIVHKGLKEDHFRTTNRSAELNGNASAVVVEITLANYSEPVKEEVVEEVVEVVPTKEEVAEVKEEVVETPVEVKEEPVVEEVAVVAEEPIKEVAPVEPVKEDENEFYCFSLRTNALYWVGLLPNIGVEWRINEKFGLVLNTGYSGWSSNKFKHNVFYINPEFRYYMGEARKFYLGASANYGIADVRSDVFAALTQAEKNYRYDGSYLAAGVLVGYQTNLTDRLALDFNIGLGFANFNYDQYTLVNGVETGAPQKVENNTKYLYPPVQAGVSLVWMFGGNK